MMSIDDPILPYHYPNKGYWILKRGKETFFNKEREMLTFDTEADALAYRDANFLPLNPSRQLDISVPVQQRLLD